MAAKKDLRSLAQYLSEKIIHPNYESQREVVESVTALSPEELILFFEICTGSLREFVRKEILELVMRAKTTRR